MQKKVRWDEYQPIRILPKTIQRYFAEDAAFLRQDLLENKLKVILIPAPEQRHYDHRIRAVEIENPSWYSRLYAKNPHFRRDRSLHALERIAARKDEAFTDRDCGIVEYKYNYDSIYRHFIFGRLTEGFVCQGQEVAANARVRDYFGLAPRNSVEEIPF